MYSQSIAVSGTPPAHFGHIQERPTSWRKVVQQVEKGLNNHESCYKRIRRLRKQSSLVRHRLDTLLICPTVKPRGLLRFLCYGAKWTEEIGEVCADFSTIVERLVRKTLSNGRNSDIAAVIGSGVGRLVTSKMNVMGLSANKAAGAFFYGVSTLLSLLVLAMAPEQGVNSGRAASNQPDRGLGWSAQHRLSRNLENQKEKLLNWAQSSNNPVLQQCSRKLSWQVSRNKRAEADNLPAERRKMHCDYIWNNLHQYGPVTRVLMITGHTMFQVTNRLFISWDKYTARLLNQTLLKKYTGELLGHRLSSFLMYSASTGLSIPASALIVGLSTIGAMICAATVLCFLSAKLSVMLGDWKGNLRPRQKTPQPSVSLF